MSDPAGFVDAARFHLVVPVLAPVLAELSLPDEHRAALEQAAAADALQNLTTAAALGEIAGALAAAEIPTVTLKGLPLAVRTTGELAGRHPGDIDVLVEPTRLSDAVEVLTSLGWDPPEGRANGIDPPWRRWLRWVFNQAAMGGPDLPAVELHWRLESTVATTVTFAELWERHETVAIGDVSVPALGEVDEMTYVTVHAGRHRVERLKWAVDVARLLDQRPGRVADMIATARRWDTTRCLDVALDAVRALGLRDPSAVPDTSVLDPLDKFPLMRFRYGLVERPTDKVRMLAGYVAPQPALDDERVPERLALVAAPFRQLWRGLRAD